MKTSGYVACYEAIMAAMLDEPRVYEAFTQHFDTAKLENVRDTFGVDLYSECMRDAQKAVGA